MPPPSVALPGLAVLARSVLASSLGFGLFQVSSTLSLPSSSLKMSLWPHLVTNPRWVSLVVQAGCDSRRQAKTPVGRLQQNSAPIGAAFLLVEFGYEGLVEELGEQDALCCGMISHAKASFVALTLL